MAWRLSGFLRVDGSVLEDLRQHRDVLISCSASSDGTHHLPRSASLVHDVDPHPRARTQVHLFAFDLHRDRIEVGEALPANTMLASRWGIPQRGARREASKMVMSCATRLLPAGARGYRSRTSIKTGVARSRACSMSLIPTSGSSPAFNSATRAAPAAARRCGLPG